MKVLVCGGRDFGNIKNRDRSDFVEKEQEYLFGKDKLEEFAIENSIYYNPDDNWLPFDIEIITGMASGADSIGWDWATANWCKVHEYPADWKQHGKSAGYIRNKQMLEEGEPDIVIAFPGGKGTAMMIKLAKDAGIEVKEIIYENIRNS